MSAFPFPVQSYIPFTELSATADIFVPGFPLSRENGTGGFVERRASVRKPFASGAMRPQVCNRIDESEESKCFHKIKLILRPTIFQLLASIADRLEKIMLILLPANRHAKTNRVDTGARAKTDTEESNVPRLLLPL
jgi:hypothetical protein